MWICALAIFYELRATITTRVILTSCLNANVSIPSGPLSLRNGLLIFGIVCLVTLLIFLHSLHLSAQLNVSTSVISSTLHSFLRAGIVSLTFVLLMFLFYFFVLFFLGRLLVLYFSLVAPAICYLFFLHVVLYVFLVNKWWWWWRSYLPPAQLLSPTSVCLQDAVVGGERITRRMAQRLSYQQSSSNVKASSSSSHKCAHRSVTDITYGTVSDLNFGCKRRTGIQGERKKR